MGFVMIDDDIFVREESIARLERKDKDEYKLVLTNGEERNIPRLQAEGILGMDRIVQLIPAKKGTKLCYSPFREYGKEKKWYRDTVDAWALTSDGRIHPVNYDLYIEGGLYGDFMDSGNIIELDVPLDEEEIDIWENRKKRGWKIYD